MNQVVSIKNAVASAMVLEIPTQKGNKWTIIVSFDNLPAKNKVPKIHCVKVKT